MLKFFFVCFVCFFFYQLVSLSLFICALSLSLSLSLCLSPSRSLSLPLSLTLSLSLSLPLSPSHSLFLSLSLNLSLPLSPPSVSVTFLILFDSFRYLHSIDLTVSKHNCVPFWSSTHEASPFYIFFSLLRNIQICPVLFFSLLYFPNSFSDS